MVGGEHSLKISDPQLLWFGIDSALNIFPQAMSYLFSYLSYLNHEAVYRTAPATPGLLTTKFFLGRIFTNFGERCQTCEMDIWLTQ